MASFAIVEDGLVIEVVKLDDAVITGPDGKESEALGQAFLADQYGTAPARYVQTSYTNAPVEGKSRGKYAGIGDTWTGTVFESPTDAPTD